MQMPKGVLACRLCSRPLDHVMVDLGMSPLSNSYLAPQELLSEEIFYPLRVLVCGECLLVQLPAFESPATIFGDYLYFSSYSSTWLKHAEDFARKITASLDLDENSSVVEVASNDGYLLKYFRGLGIPVLGIEPAGNVAKVAEAIGIPTVVEFFGLKLAEILAESRGAADLIIANNVLAHVPDVNDFVKGIRRLLKREGVATLEFPHVVRLVEGMQFDTIYHEHFSYFSLTTVVALMRRNGLRLFDVEELSTHGGSLRIWVSRDDSESRTETDRVSTLLDQEAGVGANTLDFYTNFSSQVENSKRKLLEILLSIRSKGQTVVGYGAPAKATTLLNYCGMRTDFISFTVDKSPHKHGRSIPGVRIPILDVRELARAKPDYVLIFTWNILQEVVGQLSHIRGWGAKFIVPVPSPMIF